MNFLRSALSSVRSLCCMKNQIVSFHSAPFCRNILPINHLNHQSNELLIPTVLTLSHSRGMKYQLKAKKRCEHCYLIWKDGRVFNYCKVKPRHNHASIVKKDIARLIICHRTFNTRRPW